MRKPRTSERLGVKDTQFVPVTRVMFLSYICKHPPATIVLHNSGVSRVQIIEQHCVHLPLPWKLGASVQLNRAISSGLGNHVKLILPFKHARVREMVICLQHCDGSCVVSLTIHLYHGDVALADSINVFLDKDEVLTRHANGERIRPETVARRDDVLELVKRIVWIVCAHPE